MYEATFTGWWQWAVDILFQTASKELSFVENKLVSIADTQTYVQRKLATSICATAQRYCLGPTLQQYQNATACYEFLTTKTRFGEAYELGMPFFAPPFPVVRAANVGYRPEHAALSHGASEHGSAASGGPLPAYRSVGRGILHRYALVR